MRSIWTIKAIVLVTWGISIVQAQGGFRYLEFPLTNPNRVYKAEKLWNAQTGRLEVNLTQDGNTVATSLIGMEQQEANGRKALLGNLSPQVDVRLASLTDMSSIKVAIYLRYPPFSYPDKTLVDKDAQIASSLSSMSVQPVITTAMLALRYGLTGMEARGNGILAGNVTRAQLLAMKGDSDIAAVEEDNPEKRLSVELPTLATSAYNPGSVPSGAGYGVRAATWETGITSDFLNCVSVSPAAWDANVSNVPSDIRHANATFRVLVASVPSATFYHRRSDYYSGTSDQSYLINNAIQTTSMSTARGDLSPYHSTYSEFLVMDDFAYRYPYPVFTTPSGSAGYSYEVNWQAYNAINIGNVRHTNTSTYELADCTQTKNPPPIYGSCISGTGSNCAGDREMPYLVVPGIPSSGSDFASTCLYGSGTVSCGTSFSAPIANGIAADIIAADSRMASWPEKVRAAMILTAQNVDGGYWSSGTDGRDGSGVISGSEAVSFALNHTSVSTGNTAVEMGMNASSIYASDFGAAYKRFNYLVPNPKPSGKHLRVVLTWDSNPIVGGSTNALSDMDLIVQKNSTTQSSTSWDGNVEVVDIAAADVTAGSSYYIDVAPLINRIPTSGSRTNFFYYAIAWAWVKDHAD